MGPAWPRPAGARALRAQPPRAAGRPTGGQARPGQACCRGPAAQGHSPAARSAARGAATAAPPPKPKQARAAGRRRPDRNLWRARFERGPDTRRLTIFRGWPEKAVARRGALAWRQRVARSAPPRPARYCLAVVQCKVAGRLLVAALVIARGRPGACWPGGDKATRRRRVRKESPISPRAA